MLDPRDRVLLLESLRPPDGYRLDRAVGTSYTLDLLALLTAPLAFTFFDWEDQDGKPAADPIALLESVRRHAGHIHLFCQAGEIKLPPPSQRLVAYLERCVIPVQAPADRDGNRGIFHPKVWLLRYVADGEPVRYRFICASRNLTFDRSWDVILCVDGELVDRTRAISVSKPIGEFIAALPGLAVCPVAPEVRAEIARMALEVQRVRFERPSEIEEIVFWPMGIDGHQRWPFPAERRTRPILITSPFVSPALLNRLTEDRDTRFLVSRPEQLASLPQDTLSRFDGVYLLSSAMEDTEEDREGVERSTLAGLHAKIFIEDDGWYARVYVGSANATLAAFERNVEFMTELKGKKKDFGIDAFLGAEGTKHGMRAMLEPWQAGEHSVSEEEAIAQMLETELVTLRRLIAAHPLTLRCVLDERHPDRYHVELNTVLPLPEAVRAGWSCWLTTQHQESGVAINGAEEGALARFGPVGLASLSAFLACQLRARHKGVSRVSNFVLNLPIEGLPTARLDRLLASQIQDRDRLLRLLLLLLQPDGAAAAFADTMLGSQGGGDQQRVARARPLFETLVRATVDGQDRIADMGRLLEDLMRTNEGRALVPEALLELWQEVKKAVRSGDE